MSESASTTLVDSFLDAAQLRYGVRCLVGGEPTQHVGGLLLDVPSEPAHFRDGRLEAAEQLELLGQGQVDMNLWRIPRTGRFDSTLELPVEPRRANFPTAPNQNRHRPA